MFCRVVLRQNGPFCIAPLPPKYMNIICNYRESYFGTSFLLSLANT